MITKTYKLILETEDEWSFEYEQGSTLVTLSRDNQYKGCMTLEELQQLVEFKKAIDDLA